MINIFNKKPQDFKFLEAFGTLWGLLYLIDNFTQRLKR